MLVELRNLRKLLFVELTALICFSMTAVWKAVNPLNLNYTRSLFRLKYLTMSNVLTNIYGQIIAFSLMKHCLLCNNSLQAIKWKFLSNANGTISFFLKAKGHFLENTNLTNYSLWKSIGKKSFTNCYFFFLTGLFWHETKIPVAQQLTLGVVNISIQPNVTGLYVVVHVSMQKIQVQQLHV